MDSRAASECVGATAHGAMGLGTTPLALPDVTRDSVPVRRGPALAGYAQFSCTFGDATHTVYHAGLRSHPPVLILPEIAGLAPGYLLFAQRLVETGFQVYLPWLVGPFGRRAPLRNVLRLCVSREFARLRAGETAPVTVWLRALISHISQHNGEGNVGAIGMCLTGAFAIPMILHPKVAVPGLRPPRPCTTPGVECRGY
jgi:hypothetical protein